MRTTRDEGFGLVEVLVAMLLLMIIMMAMIGVVVTSLSVTAGNATRATALEAIQQRLEQARAASVTGYCEAIEDVVTAEETVVDGRGLPIVIQGEMSECVASGVTGARDPAQLVRVTVTATSDDPRMDAPVSTTTDLFLKFES